MQAVVADTSPLSYLILIRQIDILPRLFGTVTIPMTVVGELCRARAPAAVQLWAASPPSWLVLHADPADPPPLPQLDPGERAAIALALTIAAKLLLVDDKAGTAAARSRGLETVGTIGILDLAVQRGLLDLSMAFAALRDTNFRYRPTLLDALLTADRLRREKK